MVIWSQHTPSIMRPYPFPQAYRSSRYPLSQAKILHQTYIIVTVRAELTGIA